jgi:2-oxoglutarate ferredoxin oxidoreductase subunit alpha
MPTRTQQADLANRLQTPVFVMTDFDIGMNTRLCRPFACDDSKRIDRGTVMDFDMLESGRDFGRYLDVDGDGIPFRTYPGTHPTKGAYFTRGTTRNPCSTNTASRSTRCGCAPSRSPTR